MADGDIAAAAGMAIVPPTALVKNGYNDTNKTRDYVKIWYDKAAALVSQVWATSRGGTGTSNVYGVTTSSSGPNTAIMMIQSSGRIARGTGALPPSYIPNLALDRIDQLPATLAQLEARIAALERRSG